MAVELLASNQQIRMLKQQSAAALHCAQVLRIYKDEIKQVWGGKDAECFTKGLEQQICKCEALSVQLDHLACDIMQATTEILAEAQK